MPNAQFLMPNSQFSKKWQFFIDRGGTFTDVVAIAPDGRAIIHKLLSENPDRYSDAAVQGIRDILGIPAEEPIPSEQIETVKMGTTVATNALLERKGDSLVLAITQGFRDALRIGYQNRPDIFARQIVLPEMLYERTIEVEQRYNARGEEVIPFGEEQKKRLIAALQESYAAGVRSCAIVLMHSYRKGDREKEIAQIAREIGFSQVSVSHELSPLMKLVRRGDTAVVDAYLSPILRRYVSQVASQLGNVSLLFMQSNGGLADAQQFQGKDSILSGPAGGIVGAVQASRAAGFEKIITFDMGGTSTDVAHYDGEYERQLETEIAGARLQTPMMAIHTVAAGGSSLVEFDGARYRVGPESAGANPGPACYRRGGPLAVTDCNLILGKIQPRFFPKVFGANGDLPLDAEIARQKFGELAAEIERCTGDKLAPEEVAAGFVAIAVDNMANAIKKISLQRGYDVSEYTLCCFGGAGGQHACLIADALGIKQIFIHPYAGVLSAYGIGLADVRTIRQRTVEAELSDSLIPSLQELLAELEIEAKKELTPTGREEVERKVQLKYRGTDSTMMVKFAERAGAMKAEFEAERRQRYGFVQTEKALIVEAVSVEVIQKMDVPEEALAVRRSAESPAPVATVKMYAGDRWQDTPVFQRSDLQPGDCIQGAALIVEATGTNVIEPGWQAELSDRNCLILSAIAAKNNNNSQNALSLGWQNNAQKADPVMLEIFNNLFRFIAEEMGITLQNTASSVNIKERLDFSCAIFDGQGQLVANAPHMPVHLGSMSESVGALIAARGDRLQPGDLYISNNPYNGGTHLPDVTAIAPVFSESDNRLNSSSPLFYVASRGHHADIGGITPGSMPPNSKTVEEEGVLLDNFQLVGRLTPIGVSPASQAAGAATQTKPGGLPYYKSETPLEDSDVSSRLTPKGAATQTKPGGLPYYKGETPLEDSATFREKELLELLTGGSYPSRNTAQNIADLQAQIAANEKGARSLRQMVEQYGLETVRAYMGHVQDNAEESVRRAIDVLKDGRSAMRLDNGSVIKVAIAIDRATRSAKIDFSGTSAQLANNFNAPAAVCKAAVLYVFRTLVDDNIPLNGGCLKPLQIIIPEGSMLQPRYPAAVVAGNVETSQAIVDALYEALGVMAGSQGTMNNFTFGSDRYQYYETISGGSGAGADFDGTDVVQTHMTNSRLTDPEVLEWRFPVLLESFSIRANSGGGGRYRGGNGAIRRIRFLEEMTAAILSNRRLVAPSGLNGGGDGALGRNYVERCNGTVEDLGSTATVRMHPGDILAIETPGGGGFGKVKS
ncbi:MAG: 5-oxoprolinase [Oscillatoria sp. SIO1A7]|nr:5-oxoprolinase [Oscillatoria sp. SIO1A7]